MRTLEERKKKAKKISAELKKLFPESKVFLRHKNPWELLVAVILSAQCTDKKVNEVTERLFKKYRKFGDYLKVKPNEFEKDIRETGFFRMKTRHILGAAKKINEELKGKVPKTMEELRTLPGVGRKTANIVLWSAFRVVSGIPVDTHVKRLTRRLELSQYTDPEKIEKDLMEVFSEKEWGTISYRFIDYGRKFCPARSHNHKKCPLAKYETNRRKKA